MYSPTMPPARIPPPIRHCQSLEGLEKVIPPRYPYNYPLRSRTELCVNKPLPAEPLVESLALNTGDTAVWSDDSMLDSDGSRTSGSRPSSESFPIFVHSGEDEDTPFAGMDDLHADDNPFIRPPSPHTSEEQLSHDDMEASMALNSFLIEERYGRQLHWTPQTNQHGTNHYFREKKWDFFPELATPGNQMSTTLKPSGSKSRRADGSRLHWNPTTRWHRTSDRSGLSFVRDSIRSYVHRTLSKGSSDHRRSSKSEPRPTTAPSAFMNRDSIVSLVRGYRYTPSPVSTSSPSSSHGGGGRSSTDDTACRHHHQLAVTHHRHEDSGLCDELRSLSLSTASNLSERPGTGISSTSPSAPTPVQRQKPLAVPLSPYQKYGATIWETSRSSKSKRISYKHGYSVRLPNYRRHSTTHTGTSSTSRERGTSTARQKLTLHDGTSTVKLALDGAKRKLAGSKADRRRAQLKKQIKLVGPVNPHTYGGVNPWI